MKVEDPCTVKGFRRFSNGTVAEVLEFKSRLTADRRWHYKLKLEGQVTSSCGRVLSPVIYATKEMIKKCVN